MPLAKTIPGVRRYEVNSGPIGTPQGPSNLHLAAIITFDSLSDIQHALTSPEGLAAAADLANFAQAGVDLLVFDSKDV